MSQRAIASGTSPGVVEEVEAATRSALARPWNVIVHDDPVTLMSYVVVVLRRVFSYSEDRANALMMEVHTKGRSIVWTGPREQAELYVFRLHASQLRATMEQVEA